MAEDAPEVEEGEELGIDAKVAALEKRAKLLMMLLAVAVLLAAGSGAFAFMTKSSLEQEVKQVREVAEKIDSGKEEALEGIADPARDVGIIHPIDTFVVNLMDPANLRYVNCRIEVEVEDPATVKLIKDRDAQFKDAAISLLGNQSYQDVLGAEGKSRLREELLVRFNRLLPEGQVSRVYLTEFVVQ